MSESSYIVWEFYLDALLSERSEEMKDIILSSSFWEIQLPVQPFLFV